MLISDEYRALNRKLHEDSPAYGRNGFKYASTVIEACFRYGTSDVLDYGCGKGKLAKALKAFSLDVKCYDPAIPGRDSIPVPADIVVCRDVMEHVEPEYLDNVIKHLRFLTKKCLLLVISTKLSEEFLSDGRNAHICVKTHRFWHELFAKEFEIVNFKERGGIEVEMECVPRSVAFEVSDDFGD